MNRDVIEQIIEVWGGHIFPGCAQGCVCLRGAQARSMYPLIEADLRETLAGEIEAGFAEWDALGAGGAPYAQHSPGWLVERAYAHAARIVRNGASDE